MWQEKNLYVLSIDKCNNDIKRENSTGDLSILYKTNVNNKAKARTYAL